MKEAYEYLGHSIELTLTAYHEHLGYTDFIDTQYCFEGSTTSLDVDAARADALDSAHRSIVALNAMTLAERHHAAVPVSPSTINRGGSRLEKLVFQTQTSSRRARRSIRFAHQLQAVSVVMSISGFPSRFGDSACARAVDNSSAR